MKKFLTFLVAALMSASAFASIDVVPSDAVLADYYNPGDVCVCFFVPADMACNDVVLTGSFNGWSSTVADCVPVEAVEGYDGWYVASFEAEAEPDPEKGMQAKPIMLDVDGNFNWEYQVGAATAIRGGVQVVQGGYAGEIDLINYGADAPNVFTVDAWKQNPCTAIYHNYTVTVINDGCDGLVIPFIVGTMTNWGFEQMQLDVNKTQEYQTAVYTYSFKAAEGTAYQIVSAGMDPQTGMVDALAPACWCDEAYMQKLVDGVWKRIPGEDLENQLTHEEANIVWDLRADSLRWARCAPPEAEEYTVVAVHFPELNCPQAIEIIGSFDEWQGTDMDLLPTGWYFVEIEAKASQTFKFRQAGTWDNVIQYYNEAIGTWDNLMDLTFGELWTDDTYRGTPCKWIELDLSDPNMYRWSYQPVTPPAEYTGISVNDNSLADWDVLPAGYLMASRCPSDAAFLGLKSVKVFADATYINILVEPNMDDIIDLEYVPFHVYLNTDNSDATGGFGGFNFTDANTDVLLEGALFESGEPCAYMPAAYQWVGEVGGSSWDWSVLVDQLQDCSSQYVNGKFEIKINRNNIPANWNVDQFGIGFDIQQNWESVGILPQVSPTDENPIGRAHKIQVPIYTYSPAQLDTTTVHFEIFNNITREHLYVIAYDNNGMVYGDWFDVTTERAYDVTTTLPVGSVAHLQFYLFNGNPDDYVDYTWYDIDFTVADTTYQVVVTDNYAYYGIIRSPLIYSITDAELHTAAVVGHAITAPMDLVIPDTIEFNGETYTVTSISNEAFRNCEYLRSVELGENINSLGYNTFSGCYNIKAVQWNIRALESNSNSVDFGGNVEMLRFGNHVEVIPSYLCQNMPKLTELEIPASVRTIGDNALFCGGGIGEDANHLRKLVIHSVNIEEDLAYNGRTSGIMLNPNLDTLVTPANLIGDQLFYVYGEYPMTARKISYLKITTGELTDEWSALKYIRLSERTLKTLDAADASNTTLPDKAFSGLYNLTTLILPANLESISYKAVEGCVSLTSITIPASVLAIDPSAFEHCRSLNTINFEEGSQLLSIGNWAFYNAHALANLTLPESVEYIGEGAFYGCTYLENVYMPASVRRVADNAFALCERMTSMTVEAVVPPTADARTFYGVSRNIPVYVPDQAVITYQNAPVWQEFFICPISEAPSGIENGPATNDERLTTKILRDGQVLIIKNGKLYNALGAELK